MSDRWVQRWPVPSSSKPGKDYTVAIDADGNYGCSCPAWTQNRRECRHIKQIKAQQAALQQPKPTQAKAVKVAQPVKVLPSPMAGVSSTNSTSKPASIASFLELDE